MASSPPPPPPAAGGRRDNKTPARPVTGPFLHDKMDALLEKMQSLSIENATLTTKLARMEDALLELKAKEPKAEEAKPLVATESVVAEPIAAPVAAEPIAAGTSIIEHACTSLFTHGLTLPNSARVC